MRNIQKYLFIEIAIIMGFLVLINNFIGQVKTTINADGIGYYDYLPSLLIHYDFTRKDATQTQDSSLYTRINSTGVYVDYEGFKVNKYACGSAILQLPFFWYAYSTSVLENSAQDGYQYPYQRAVFYAAIFYLFLSLIFLGRMLYLFEVQPYAVVLCQFLLVFSTAIVHYANAEAGFSHVYSMFAITAFAYFVKAFFNTGASKYFILSALFLGLIFSLRQVNILVVLFIPFLAGSFQILTSRTIEVCSRYSTLVGGLGMAVLMGGIQCLVWYAQTGSFVLYSYQNEGFNFTDPQFVNILFSYKKGLFIYTPVLFFSILSLVWMGFKRNYYLTTSWFMAFGILTYVFSSWWSWYYGCSYGLRAYIDYYALFFIPIGLYLSRGTSALKIVSTVLLILTAPVNVVQAYQYKAFILHWIDMDKNKYWQVFLKTKEVYQGFIWKTQLDVETYHTKKSLSLGNVITNNGGYYVFYLNSLEIPDFNSITAIQVQIDRAFLDTEESKVVVSIADTITPHTYFWHAAHLYHFKERNTDLKHTGLYNYTFSPIEDVLGKRILVEVQTKTPNDTIENMRIQFLSKK